MEPVQPLEGDAPQAAEAGGDDWDDDDWGNVSKVPIFPRRFHFYIT